MQKFAATRFTDTFCNNLHYSLSSMELFFSAIHPAAKSRGNAMSQECKLLEKCGFFNKYQEGQYGLCNAFIKQYCRGDKQEQCKRKQYRQMHNMPPPDNMVPTGQMFHLSAAEVQKAKNQTGNATDTAQKKTFLGTLKAFFTGH